jgi:nucleotide-binding universal stress UspA family protein
MVPDDRLHVEGGGGTMFERIVLAVDGSEPAQRAVPVAADIASKYGSEVIAVHVVEQQLGRGGPIASDTRGEAAREGEAARDADDAARSLKDVGVSARAEARAALAGRAAQEIMDVAASEDAGLIVMRSRGMSDWQGLLIGSVAHKVLHLSSVPVLIIR